MNINLFFPDETTGTSDDNRPLPMITSRTSRRIILATCPTVVVICHCLHLAAVLTDRLKADTVVIIFILYYQYFHCMMMIPAGSPSRGGHVIVYVRDVN